MLMLGAAAGGRGAGAAGDGAGAPDAAWAVGGGGAGEDRDADGAEGGSAMLRREACGCAISRSSRTISALGAAIFFDFDGILFSLCISLRIGTDSLSSSA